MPISSFISVKFEPSKYAGEFFCAVYAWMMFAAS